MSDPTWGIYVRVSTRHQTDGFSLDHQRETLTAYANQSGWAHQIFEDAGISGETLANRPGMLALLDAIKQGEIGGVLVVDESRLARDELVAAMIRDQFKRAGAKLAIPGRGELDLSDPSSSFMAGVLAQVHALEQDLRIQKMKAGLRRTAEAGFWPGGPPPFGYRIVDANDGSGHKELAINDEEAALLRLVADLIANHGFTTYSVAEHLNAEGIRTRQGSPWRHQNLSWQLRRKHLTGSWTYRHPDRPVTMAIPAILSPDDWNRLQRAIRGKPRPQRRYQRYPLTGRSRVHLRCECGGNFFGYVDVGRRGRAYYRCSRNDSNLGASRCPHLPRTFRTQTLNQLVWQEVESALTDPDYLRSLAAEFVAGNTVDDHHADGERIARLERRLGHLRADETAIIRQLARTNGLHNDALDRALGEIGDERIGIEAAIAHLRQRTIQQEEWALIPDRVAALAETAKTHLNDPTEELMAEVFDLLEIDLVRVATGRFDGAGSIPVPSSEVSEEALPALEPLRG